MYLEEKYDDDYEPTVLDVYRGSKNLNEKQVEIEIQDCSGDDLNGVNRKVQYEDSDVFLICAAANIPESLDNVSNWMNEI